MRPQIEQLERRDCPASASLPDAAPLMAALDQSAAAQIHIGNLTLQGMQQKIAIEQAYMGQLLASAAGQPAPDAAKLAADLAAVDAAFAPQIEQATAEAASAWQHATEVQAEYQAGMEAFWADWQQQYDPPPQAMASPGVDYSLLAALDYFHRKDAGEV